MKKKAYVNPECQVVYIAQVVLFSTSGEDPITPGIGNVKTYYFDDDDDSEENNVIEFHPRGNIWNE